MSYAAQQWTTDLMLPILDDIKAKKILVPCGYSALYDPKYAKYFSELPKYLRKFDATVYMSDHYRDIDFARKHKLKNIHLIPNGADENEFNKLPEQSEKKKIRSQYGIKGLMLMTIANYTGEKGHTELIRVFKRLPLPVATLVSAGAITPHIGSYDDFKKQADRVNTSRRFPGKNVIMVDGSKRDEVIELLKCADIFVFLSNIEASPLVLFESAAAGVPFVATAAGNSREIAQWTSAGIIVRSLDKPNGRVSADIKDAVWQIMRLAFNPIKRRRLGRAGRKVWAEKYTWQKLTEQYLDLYRSLLGAEK
jgi:glycosyltransferase involved in cell wall biosynthesis